MAGEQQLDAVFGHTLLADDGSYAVDSDLCCPACAFCDPCHDAGTVMMEVTAEITQCVPNIGGVDLSLLTDVQVELDTQDVCGWSGDVVLGDKLYRYHLTITSATTYYIYIWHNSAPATLFFFANGAFADGRCDSIDETLDNEQDVFDCSTWSPVLSLKLRYGFGGSARVWMT